MDDKQYQNLTNTLNKAGGAWADGQQASEAADAQVEQALLLKAVGVRKDELGNPKSAAGAMKEVTDFAEKVRGMDRSDLLNKTTTIDIDVNTSTSDIRPTQTESDRKKLSSWRKETIIIMTDTKTKMTHWFNGAECTAHRIAQWSNGASQY
jgi:hypothetical protein